MPLYEPDQALLSSMRLYYQPILSLADGLTDHVEVLFRSAGEDGALRGPEAIVHAMASSGRALPLTLAIMRRALAEYRAYRFAATNLVLAFNLPLEAMLDPELGQTLDDLCDATGIGPRYIQFELTETSPVEDFPATADAISRLYEAGYHVALDDVSPETPFLASLMTLPIHAIKFSNTLVGDPDALPFIRTTAARAAAHGLHSIAEGIETQAHLSAMQNAGATHGQGYFFSRPLPACDLGPALCSAA